MNQTDWVNILMVVVTPIIGVAVFYSIDFLATYWFCQTIKRSEEEVDTFFEELKKSNQTNKDLH